MLPPVIGLAGRAGAGKSTAAAFLVDHHGYVRTALAAPLKAMMAAFYAACGLPEDDINARLAGHLKEQPDPLLLGRSPRHGMQTLGTEWGRVQMGEALWVSAWKASACAVLDQGGRVVVDDVRFEDEAAAVRALGGIVICVTRPSLAPIQTAAHASEAGVLPDAMLPNTADRTALGQSLSRLIGAVAVDGALPDTLSAFDV